MAYHTWHITHGISRMTYHPCHITAWHITHAISLLAYHANQIRIAINFLLGNYNKSCQMANQSIILCTFPSIIFKCVSFFSLHAVFPSYHKARRNRLCAWQIWVTV